MDCKQIQEQMHKLPKEELGFFPTPLHKLENIVKETGVELYIKRDDFSGRNLFGGNKIRKLEYVLGEAKRRGCDTVFTYGATQSNHAMQTVTAARKLGMTPILYLVSVVDPDENDVRSNLLLDTILGAEIHIVPILPGETEDDAEERSFQMGKEHAAKLEKEGHKCVDVPMGGANEIGSSAFIDGFAEMYLQMEALGKKPDYVFHGTGTGGTLAGLSAGKVLSGADTKIIAVQVSKKDEIYKEKVCKLANAALNYAGFSGVTVTKDAFTLEPGFYEPGYELPNQASNDAIRKLARMEGILTDPVYSGKAFAGCLDYILSGKIPAGSTVVFWHTGGATALFAESAIIGDLNKL